MRFLFGFLLALIVVQTQAQSKKRVLFIGNSYTYVNDLPKILADAALTVNDTLIYDNNTIGGYTLERHSTNATTLSKIRSGNWDYVVLQEQSQRPSFPISQVETEVFPYARFLDSTIREHNPCTQTLFYMTWGRKNGDARNCATWPPVCTYQGMDSLLHLRYLMMTDSNNASVSPVGAVWNYIIQNYRAIDLYQPDQSHPSPSGSYAAACTFYAAIFRKDPSLITYDFGLNTNDALNIRLSAKKIAYDSLSHWRIEDKTLLADFGYTATSTYTYQFTNNSKFSTGQIWDIAGTIDNSENPAFTFPGPGNYAVTLTSFNSCDTNTTSQNISIVASGIQVTSNEKEIKVFPNPATDIIYLNTAHALKTTVFIYDMMGKNVKKVIAISGEPIDISNLSNGVYHIVLELENQKFVKKLVVH